MGFQHSKGVLPCQVFQHVGADMEGGAPVLHNGAQYTAAAFQAQGIDTHGKRPAVKNQQVVKNGGLEQTAVGFRAGQGWPAG
jgi:hypothetical protein